LILQQYAKVLGLERLQSFNTQIFVSIFQGRAEAMLVFLKEGPASLIHGTRDEVVPFEQTERMYETLKAVGVEVTFLPTEWGHDWGTGWYEVAQHYLAFFQRHLCV
jgi:predicted esterase